MRCLGSAAELIHPHFRFWCSALRQRLLVLLDAIFFGLVCFRSCFLAAFAGLCCFYLELVRGCVGLVSSLYVPASYANPQWV